MLVGLVVAMVVGFGLAGPVAAYHTVDSETNDACESANAFPTDNEDHYGSLDGYPGDYKDFYRRWVAAGDNIFLRIYAFSADLNLVLHKPGCVVAAFDYETGSTGESLSYTATTSGNWYAEVWHQVGSATTYTVRFDVTRSEPPPCVPTYADPATINEFYVGLTGAVYYIEERDSSFPSSPPVPGSGFVLGEGTWMYEESNDLYGLQRGGVSIWGDQFLVLIGQDPISDETCGSGPDSIIVNFYT